MLCGLDYVPSEWDDVLVGESIVTARGRFNRAPDLGRPNSIDRPIKGFRAIAVWELGNPELLSRSESLTWAEFHDAIGLYCPPLSNKAGAIACNVARDRGLGYWEWIVEARRFQRVGII